MKDKKGKRSSAILNKFLILRGVDWKRFCVLSVFKKFRFRLSTRTRANSVFKKFHSGERFRKVPFSMIVFIGYLWTEAVPVKKKLQIRVDRALSRAKMALGLIHSCLRIEHKMTQNGNSWYRENNDIISLSFVWCVGINFHLFILNTDL